MEKKLFVDRLYHDDRSVVIQEFRELPQALFDKKIEMTADLGLCAILDTETTGLNYQQDEIIEIAIRKWVYHKKDHYLIKPLEEYSSLQEPLKNELPEKITEITGLKQEDLLGKKIDWSQVSDILSQADFILAHHASFDRPMVESVPEIASVSKSKIWTCSLKQINWEHLGFLSSKQEILSIFHGFYYSGHRGLIDIDALANLMMQGDYLKTILADAKIKKIKINCLKAPFESKDLLKANGFTWNAQRRFWTKVIAEHDLEEMKSFLTDQVYHQGPMLADCIPIDIRGSFQADVPS